MARHAPRGGISRPAAKQGQHILAPVPLDDDDVPPAFGFYFTMPDYGLTDHTDGDRLAFVEAVRRRSQMTWSQLWADSHKKLGLEPIRQSQIRVPLPRWMTKDHVILVLRCGGLRRMIGVRNGRIFEVIWLDCDGSVYDHGA